MGTSVFAIPILEMLAKNFTIKKVICQPDRKAGRKQILTPPPTKERASELGLTVYQPESLKDKEVLDYLESLRPDFIVVAAYGQILPRSILEIPKEACLNIHASLLPKYRGASPIQTVILEGEKESGVSIMIMDEGLDSGPVIKQASLDIQKNDDYLSLEGKLAKLGAETLLEVLNSDKLEARTQNEKEASFTKTLSKEDGFLDFKNKTAIELERQIRAFSFWPQTYTIWNKKRLKILEADTEQVSKYKAGEVYLENSALKVACFRGALVLRALQLEGKKKVSAIDFQRGYPSFVGSKLA